MVASILTDVLGDDWDTDRRDALTEGAPTDFVEAPLAHLAFSLLFLPLAPMPLPPVLTDAALFAVARAGKCLTLHTPCMYCAPGRAGRCLPLHTCVACLG